MTDCPNCGSTVSHATEKNLKGRTHAKRAPQKCPDCGCQLEKAERQQNRNILNK